MQKEKKNKMKAIRKTVREQLITGLVKELTINIDRLSVSNTASIKKCITKSSKQLAKKLSKKITIDEAALTKAINTASAESSSPVIEQKSTKKFKPKELAERQS
jgi:SOS response regulatory protein OraA/RecX